MIREEAIQKARNFHCPRYSELPDMGLYLEQVISIVTQALLPISTEGNDIITGAMISNYIKNNALSAPIKKKYTREHLCYMIVLGILKQVFTLQQISIFFTLQKQTYDLQEAYDYFCTEFENALKEAFDFTGQPLPSIETKRTDQTILVRAMVLSAANRVYVEKVYL